MITWPILVVACWVWFFIGFFTAAVMAAGKRADGDSEQ